MFLYLYLIQGSETTIIVCSNDIHEMMREYPRSDVLQMGIADPRFDDGDVLFP